VGLVEPVGPRDTFGGCPGLFAHISYGGKLITLREFAALPERSLKAQSLLDSLLPASVNGLLPGFSPASHREGTMKINLKQQLDQLPQMERSALQKLWLELFGKLPNPKLRRELLVPILAYRLQEKAFGGLKPSTAKRLKAVAEEFANGKKPAGSPSLRTKTGTRFIREWQGQLHEVAVLDKGLEYKGRTYRSLSEIAREITGTRWSGPAFFGLKKRDARRAA